MASTVRLSDHLIKEAQKIAALNMRSVPKQIEYYYMLGKIAEDNPDLPMSFIKESMAAKVEVDNGETSDFIFED